MNVVEKGIEIQVKLGSVSMNIVYGFRPKPSHFDVVREN